MQTSRQTTLNRKNLSIRVSHDVFVVDEVFELDRQKIRLMNHRLKLMIGMILSIHRTTMILLSHVTQMRGVLCALRVNRKIRLMLSLRKTREIHLSCHVNRKNHRTGQLQTGFRKPSFQPKHPNMRNEQTSLQTSHLFNLCPLVRADNANRQGRAMCNDK